MGCGPLPDLAATVTTDATHLPVERDLDVHDDSNIPLHFRISISSRRLNMPTVTGMGGLVSIRVTVETDPVSAEEARRLKPKGCAQKRMVFAPLVTRPARKGGGSATQPMHVTYTYIHGTAATLPYTIATRAWIPELHSAKKIHDARL